MNSRRRMRSPSTNRKARNFPVVVIPLAMSQYMLLQRNLLYTGITRGRKLVVIVGQRRALFQAIRQQSARERFSGLLARLRCLGNQMR